MHAPIGKLVIDNTPYCINCANAVNQYFVPYVESTDEGYCTVRKNLVTGQHARCVELRAVGVSTARCGEAGSLFVAREIEVM
jgi:hypothetical protein